MLLEELVTLKMKVYPMRNSNSYAFKALNGGRCYFAILQSLERS